MSRNTRKSAERFNQKAARIFKERIAPADDLILVFSVCAFPIYVWSISITLYKIPAWQKQYSAWDMIGVIAYSQFFALIETTSVFLVIVILGAILPARLLREKFAPLASTILLLTSIMLILIQYNNQILPRSSVDREIIFAIYMASIGLLYLVSIATLYILIHRSKKAEETVLSLAKRIMVLSFIYLGLGFLSTITVVVRNI